MALNENYNFLTYIWILDTYKYTHIISTLLKTIRGANKKVKKTERDTHVLAYNG